MERNIINRQCQVEPTIQVEQTRSERIGVNISLVKMQDGAFFAVQQENNENVIFAGTSQGASVINRMIGVDYYEMIELFTRAVNNRTRQRNYFRLQNSLLEGRITEEEFFKTIEKNEDDYVVEEVEEPTKERLLHAIYLSHGIKDVRNSEDFSTLFSFSSGTTEVELKKLETDDSI